MGRDTREAENCSWHKFSERCAAATAGLIDMVMTLLYSFVGRKAETFYIYHLFHSLSKIMKGS